MTPIQENDPEEEEVQQERPPISRWEQLLSYGTGSHVVCIAGAVLATVPILWQDSLGEEWRDAPTQIGGQVLLGCFGVSCFLVAAEFLILLCRLSNLRAIWRVLRWGVLWGLGCGVFCLLCIMADLKPETLPAPDTPIQEDDVIHPPTDKLHGPASMVIEIQPDQFSGERVQDIPNIRRLLSQAPGMLTSIIEATPRLVTTKDNSFYAKPGHPVLTAPQAGTERPDMVHAAFCRLTPGQHLPKGFLSTKPGEPFSEVRDEKQVSTDIALELGENYYLLLAWRGESAKDHAAKGLNAAIAAFDQRMRDAADNPGADAIHRLAEGKRNIIGNKPGFSLCEPPGQFGAYQAEIYVNPGEKGNLFLRIFSRDRSLGIDKQMTLPALFSENREELFRHDIPGDALPTITPKEWDLNRLPKDFPKGVPLFVIAEGNSTKSFSVEAEVWFVPSSHPSDRVLLLRRCYRVRAYQAPEVPDAPPEKAAAEPSAKRGSGKQAYVVRLLLRHLRPHMSRIKPSAERAGSKVPESVAPISQEDARKVVTAFENKKPLPKKLMKEAFVPSGSQILRQELRRLLSQRREKTTPPASEAPAKPELSPREQLMEKLHLIKNSIKSLIP